MIKYVFIRVDDVDQYTDKLIKLTNIFVKNKINVSYQVIPMTLQEDTVKYLNRVNISRYVNDIGQHGYGHIRHGEGEFCSNRTYKDQIEDISKGMDIIKNKFPNQRSNSFTMPWNAYNLDTIKALKELNFDYYSAGTHYEVIPRIIYKFSTALNINNFFGRNISYHQLYRNGLLEMSVCIDFNKDYKTNIIKEVSTLIKEFEKAEDGLEYIGIVVHPNHIKNDCDFEKIEQFLIYIKNRKNIKIMSMKDIYLELIPKPISNDI